MLPDLEIEIEILVDFSVSSREKSYSFVVNGGILPIKLTFGKNIEEIKKHKGTHLILQAMQITFKNPISILNFVLFGGEEAILMFLFTVPQ